MLTEFDRGWEFQDEERREAEEPSSTEMGPPDEASENVDEASWDDEGGESGEDSRLGDEPSWREQVPTAPPTVAQAEGPNGTRAATGQFSGAGVTRETRMGRSAQGAKVGEAGRDAAALLAP